MKGVQHISVSTRFARYTFDLRRNITVVLGNSGTGKTTLYNMIAEHTRDPYGSGVNLSATAPCVALTDMDWKNQLAHYHDSIVFIDEDAKYVTSDAFAAAVRDSSNYYVIITREVLNNLPFSVSEIYEIKTSGKYHTFKQAYPLSEKREYQPTAKKSKVPASAILTEDSNAGHQFFASVADTAGIACESAHGNSSVFACLKQHADESLIVICDGAAFGSQIDRVVKLIGSNHHIRLLLPESFEWVILKSGLIRNVDSILENPSDYIESADYFSWENYFTALLVEQTQGTYLAYTKAQLNECYLQEKAKTAILAILPNLFKE